MSSDKKQTQNGKRNTIKEKKNAETTRIYFLPTAEKNKLLIEKKTRFSFYGGFSISQKQKTIAAFHEAIIKSDPNLRALEISSKSPNQIGVNLSAFNLKYCSNDESYNVENIYQSSKVFEKGGPFRDMLYCAPWEAKKDDRLKSSGNLTHFEFHNEIWELEPKSAFYDYIYLKALCQPQNEWLRNAIFDFNVFTDIEFNQTKSINCQARSVAIFISLSLQGLLDKTLQNKDSFISAYKNIDFNNTMVANTARSLLF
jgi:hypothetical protein